MLGRIWLALAVMLALAVPAEAAEIILYSSPNFQGDSLRVQGDIPNLREFDMNDEVSSFVIVSGEWGLYEDRNYGGRGIRAIRGSFPNMEAAGFENNELSSLKVLTPAPPPAKPLPDLTRNVRAQAGYDAKIEGSGVGRTVTDVRFRGLTVLVEIANQGMGPAGPSVARIDLGSRMDLDPVYVGKGIHPCGKREVPSSARPGGPATCIKLHAADVIAAPSGDGLTCAIPPLKPGEGARCVGVFSVVYSWMVPPVGNWVIVVSVDAGRKVKEADEKNNGQGEQIEIRGDDLPPP